MSTEDIGIRLGIVWALTAPICLLIVAWRLDELITRVDRLEVKQTVVEYQQPCTQSRTQFGWLKSETQVNCHEQQ